MRTRDKNVQKNSLSIYLHLISSNEVQRKEVLRCFVAANPEKKVFAAAGLHLLRNAEMFSTGNACRDDRLISKRGWKTVTNGKISGHPGKKAHCVTLIKWAVGYFARDFYKVFRAEA